MADVVITALLLWAGAHYFIITAFLAFKAATDPPPVNTGNRWLDYFLSIMVVLCWPILLALTYRRKL